MVPSPAEEDGDDEGAGDVVAEPAALAVGDDPDEQADATASADSDKATTPTRTAGSGIWNENTGRAPLSRDLTVSERSIPPALRRLSDREQVVQLQQGESDQVTPNGPDYGSNV
jgi:hypothetical protein